MEITIVKVKHYNGSRYHVLSVDGIPVAVTKKRGQAEKLSAYLRGSPSELTVA